MHDIGLSLLVSDLTLCFEKGRTPGPPAMQSSQSSVFPTSLLWPLLPSSISYNFLSPSFVGMIKLQYSRRCRPLTLLPRRLAPPLPLPQRLVILLA